MPRTLFFLARAEAMYAPSHGCYLEPLQHNIIVQNTYFFASNNADDGDDDDV